jgi:hypothetical protein
MKRTDVRYRSLSIPRPSRPIFRANVCKAYIAGRLARPVLSIAYR